MIIALLLALFGFTTEPAPAVSATPSTLEVPAAVTAAHEPADAWAAHR